MTCDELRLEDTQLCLPEFTPCKADIAFTAKESFDYLLEFSHRGTTH